MPGGVQPEMDPERRRLWELREQHVPWWRWGTYLPERQWGTVREDYSADGDAWESFPHEQARSRAYRWGEDGLLGWCDSRGRPGSRDHTTFDRQGEDRPAGKLLHQAVRQTEL